MAHSSIIGAIGLAHQTVKGTANTSYSYLPATSIGLNADQTAQALPLEIAGNSYLPRGSYKSGVAAAGDASFIVRPDSLGNLLLMLCGQDTVTPVPGQSGAYSHVMVPFAPSVANDLPWYTILKDVGKYWAEQYTDMRLAGFRLDVAKQSVLNAQATFFGITPQEVAVPSPETPLDNGTALQTCQATVILNNETGNVVISPQTTQVERVSLAFGTRLSQDEFVVGSFYPADVTLLSRSVQVSYDLVIRDPALRRAVYQNGGTSQWSPTLYRGHLHLTLPSNAVVPTTTQIYQLDIDLPGIDFLMMPITMSGGELMRASLSANVSLGPSGGDTFTFTLVNGTASY